MKKQVSTPKKRLQANKVAIVKGDTKEKTIKIKKKWPLAYHILLFSMRSFVVLFIAWLLSSIFLHSVLISYSAKTQRIERQIAKSEREVEHIRLEISNLTNYARLVKVAGEHGLFYSNDRIKVIHYRDDK